MAAPGKTTAEGSLGINPILTARFLSLEEKVDLTQSPWSSSAAVLRRDLEGAGGLPPPATELDALGLAILLFFFPIPMVGGGGAQEVWGARTQEITEGERKKKALYAVPVSIYGAGFCISTVRGNEINGRREFGRTRGKKSMQQSSITHDLLGCLLDFRAMRSHSITDQSVRRWVHTARVFWSTPSTRDSPMTSLSLKSTVSAHPRDPKKSFHSKDQLKQDEEKNQCLSLCSADAQPSTGSGATPIGSAVAHPIEVQETRSSLEDEGIQESRRRQWRLDKLKSSAKCFSLYPKFSPSARHSGATVVGIAYRLPDVILYLPAQEGPMKITR